MRGCAQGSRTSPGEQRPRVLNSQWRPTIWVKFTLGLTYNEFGYNEYPVIANRFLYIKLIDCSVKKFGCNEYPLITSSFFSIFLLVVSGTQCNKKLNRHGIMFRNLKLDVLKGHLFMYIFSYLTQGGLQIET